MDDFDQLNISGIQLSPRSKKRTDYNARLSNPPSSSRREQKTPYVPTYFKKVRKVDMNTSSQNNPNTEPMPNTKPLCIKPSSELGKDEVKQKAIKEKKIENKILPDERSTMHANGNTKISVYNSFNNMNYETDEKVTVNPTDPHDRVVFKEPGVSFYIENEGALLDESGLSLLEKFGPEFFQDNDLDDFFFKKAIKESKPFDVINLTTNSLTFDILTLPHPIKLVGNGKTTLYIDERIDIDFGTEKEYVYMNGFGDDKYECGGYIHDLKGNRVIFENLRICFRKDSRVDNLRVSYRRGISQTVRGSTRGINREYYLFNLVTDNQIEFIDCQIKKEKNMGDDKFNKLKILETEGIETEGGELIEDVDDSEFFYVFHTRNLKDFKSKIFFRTSFAEGFSTLKSPTIKNLVIDNAYFTDFSRTVLSIFPDDTLVFIDSKIMYQKAPGIVIDLQKGSKKSQTIVIENCHFDKNEAVSVQVTGRDKKLQLKYNNVVIKDCSFQMNTVTCVELKDISLKQMEIRDCDFFRNGSHCISARECENVKVIHSEFAKIESQVIKFNGCEGLIQECKFSDVVTGILIQNLGLGSPSKVNLDVLIEHCEVKKCLSSGISLVGVGLSSTFIKNCSIINGSIGIYIEEVEPYGTFKKVPKEQAILIHHSLVEKMRQGCIAIKKLHSLLDLTNNRFKGANIADVITDYKKDTIAQLVHKKYNYEIFEMYVELVIYDKEKEKKRLEEARKRRKVRPVESNDCSLI